MTKRMEKIEGSTFMFHELIDAIEGEYVGHKLQSLLVFAIDDSGKAKLAASHKTAALEITGLELAANAINYCIERGEHKYASKSLVYAVMLFAIATSMMDSVEKILEEVEPYREELDEVNDLQSLIKQFANNNG